MFGLSHHCAYVSHLKIVDYKGIYRKLEMYISNTQFGFHDGLGTREALFAIDVLTKQIKDKNKNREGQIHIYQ